MTEEIARNPRARSAKLRAAERTAAPAHDGDICPICCRDLPSLDDVMRGAREHALPQYIRRSRR